MKSQNPNAVLVLSYFFDIIFTNIGWLEPIRWANPLEGIGSKVWAKSTTDNGTAPSSMQKQGEKRTPKFMFNRTGPWFFVKYI